jgi:1-acyl-sn-glycerol-3-phosphate acyltransferase
VSERLDRLTEINLDDLIGALGWQKMPLLAAPARRLLRRPARAFAQQMLDFDENVGHDGLAEGARSTVRLHVRDILVYGASNLPTDSYLALSNHPGLTDTLVLFAALGRADLHTIALARPFLLSLEQVSRQLFFLPDQVAERVGLVRDVARHLRSGGAVLTFPAGRTEPDPDVYQGADDALRSWTDSAVVFARLAPGTPVVPVCVRGVTWPAAARHPLARLRRRPDDQQLLASALQLLCQVLFGTRPVTARVQIGRPVRLGQRGLESPTALHEAVLQQMAELIRVPPEGAGESVL